MITRQKENTNTAETMLVNDGRLEVMRGELRSVLNNERKNNRAFLLTQRRPALGEIKRDQTIFCNEDVAEKARQLVRGVLSRDDYVSLQNSLIKDETNINSFLQEKNALAALIRDLSCTNPPVQLIAANCCCNIALANSEVCSLLAKHAAPHIVAQLYTLNYPLLEACARIVGNLCASSETAFKILYAQGCVRAFVSLVNNCEENVLSSIVYALKFCLYAGQDIINDSEVADLTAELIRRDRCSWNKDTLWVLALLACREASHDALISVVETVCSILWKIAVNPIETSELEMSTACIRFLGNVITEPSGRAAELFLNSGNTQDVAVLLDELLSRSQNHVRKETVWFLGNLYTVEQAEIRTVVRENLIPRLNSLKCFLS